MYAAAAKAMGADKLHCWWSSGYNLDQVRSIVRFPRNLVIHSTEAAVEEIKVAELKQKTIVVESLVPIRGRNGFFQPCDGFKSLQETTFDQAYWQAAKELSFDHPNATTTATFTTTSYGVLHIRGTDRRDPSFADHTVQVLKQVVDAGFNQWIMSTDDPEFAKSIADCPYDPASADSLDNALRDLTVMSRAKFIVQHAPNGWSAFSHLIACTKQIPIINTYPSDKWNYMNIMIMHHNMIPSFFHAKQSKEFIQRIPKT
jgi:hypothetical protein